MSPTLELFFDDLDRYADVVPLDELTRRLESLDLAPEHVREHVRFSNDGYQRNLMRASSAYQALVLCWKPGQSSAIHDHRGSACGLRVLAGTAREIIYTRGSDGMLIEGDSCDLHRGKVCGSMDADIHRIVNPSTRENLITLHVYSPPLLRAGIYSLESPSVGEWLDPNAAPTGRALSHS